MGRGFKHGFSETSTSEMKKDTNDTIILQKSGMPAQQLGKKWVLGAVQSHCHKTFKDL